MKTLDAPQCQADVEVVEQINVNVMQFIEYSKRRNIIVNSAI